MADLLTVLHVDDDPSFGRLTTTFLEQETDRFSVETATSADEGLEIVSDRPPDCVVSDYNMPGMDGLEFLRAVRETHPDLPFVLFTGKGSEEVASEAIAAGVTDYIQKGGSSEQYELLANRIENAVRSRREAERADRQEELMRLTEFAGDTGGFEVDIDTGEVLMTDGVRRLVGLPDDAELSLEEAIGYYHPDDQANLRQTVTRVAETGERTRGTWRLQTLDGDERLMEVTITPDGANGGSTTLRGAIHDVTDRRERQQELRAERRFVEQALDALDDLFYVLDTEGEFQRWNDQILEVTGYTEAEFAQLDGFELFPEDGRDAVASATQTCLADGESIVEADVLTKDGERFPYEFRGARLTDATGETTGLVGIGRDLTERRQRERRFQALVEKSSDIISIVDADGIFQYQSPSLERILGYCPNEAIGESVWEFMHPDDRAEAMAAFERWIDEPDADSIVEFRVRDADGSWRWLESRGNNQFDNPAVEGYVINSRDITARKEREKELERTNDRMANMEQLADIGAWEYDPETEQVMFTDGARRIYSLDTDATASLNETFEAFHPDDRDLLRDRFETCLETGEPYEMDVRLTTQSGEQRWVTARGERVAHDGEGSVIRGYIQDITEKKEREQRLDLVETLFEHAQECQFIVDVADGEFELRHANQYYKQTVGLSADTPVTGQTPVELFGETGGQQVLDRYKECVETQDSISYTVELPVPEEGTVYQTILTPVVTGGAVTHIVGTARDVTQQVEQKEEVQRQNERLKEFAGIVSHDLQGPLDVAQGHIELAGATEANEHLAEAADAIERGQALVEDLLTLAREGDQVDETDPVVLANVAEECWETVESAAASLTVDATQTIECDRSRLRQLLENLYRNAVEHGDDAVTVHVGEIDKGFYVADAGSGIPDSEREQVFEAGYSTREDGTGFGLRIVKQVVDAHGWNITATESKRGGARFEITDVDAVEG